MCPGYFGRMQKEAEYVTKIVKIIVGGTIYKARMAETVIESGVSDGDVVVTDGHLLLTNGSRVTVRERKAGA